MEASTRNRLDQKEPEPWGQGRVKAGETRKGTECSKALPHVLRNGILDSSEREVVCMKVDSSLEAFYFQSGKYLPAELLFWFKGTSALKQGFVTMTLGNSSSNSSGVWPPQ